MRYVKIKEQKAKERDGATLPLTGNVKVTDFISTHQNELSKFFVM